MGRRRRRAAGSGCGRDPGQRCAATAPAPGALLPHEEARGPQEAAGQREGPPVTRVTKAASGRVSGDGAAIEEATNALDRDVDGLLARGLLTVLTIAVAAVSEVDG